MNHGGASVLAWAYVAASGRGSLVLINDVTHNGGSRMNFEVLKNNFVWQITDKYIQINRGGFIMQQDNDPEYTTNTTKDSIKG